MISYSPNLEDVILSRALSGVHQGFYVDVGANDPVEDSITKAFYDRGWRGINIEPVAAHYQDLVRERPHDINLNCAAGSEPGLLDLWVPMVRGWASASDLAITKHTKDGYTGAYEKVPVRTLTSILEEYRTPEVHFLKIDVEGFEHAVIQGLDLSRFRPWIVLAEATVPNSREENYQRWEPLLLSAGYHFAYFDGLNRYYVAAEHDELMAHFASPPNVFDNWKLWREIRLEGELADFRERLVATEAQRDRYEALAHSTSQTGAAIRNLDARVAQNDKHVTALADRFNALIDVTSRVNNEARQQLIRERDIALLEGRRDSQLAEERATHIAALYRSTSWRATAPLRFVKRTIRSLLRRMGYRAPAKRLLRRVASNVALRPWLKVPAQHVLNNVPSLRRRVEASLRPPQSVAGDGPSATAALTVSVQEVRDFYRTVDEAAKASPHRPLRVLLVRGDLNSHSGYAKASALYAQLLAERYDLVLGADIHAHPSRSFDTWPYHLVQSSLAETLAGRPGVELKALTISSPAHFVALEGATNVGLFFWETDRLGNAQWIELMNQLSEVWVPGAFMKPMLESEGVEVPIRHVACPLVPSTGKSTSENADSMRLRVLSDNGHEVNDVDFADIRSRNRFVFLSTNTFIPRKGFPVLLHEWVEVARQYKDVALVIKVSSINVEESTEALSERVRTLWRQVAGSRQHRANIYFTCDSLSAGMLRSLESACDAFVTTSFGEGLGLGLFESLLAGKPVICAKHTSFEELLPADYPYFLETEFANFGVADPVGVYPISARWGVPVEGSLVTTIGRLRHDMEAGLVNTNVKRAIDWVTQASRPNLPEVTP